ncbi:hypothetical protein WG915_09480 [Corynebacterium sp. H128]|uniref:hypothetical protein n=1 Tax=Corynebacterium sp. H128 TaxID=3133427 RepID=UPI003097A74A
MSNSNGSYPHPVLGNLDDVNSTFRVFNVVISCDTDFVELQFELQTDDPDVLERMDKELAIVAVKVSCATTFYNQTLLLQPKSRKTNGGKYEISFDQRDLRGNVDAQFLLLSTVPEDFFKWQRQHSEYGDATFSLKRGDVLADGGMIRFDAAKSYDPLDPPLGSCFRLVPDDRLKKRMEISFSNEEQITLLIPTETADFLSAHPDMPEFAINCVILPALIGTIDKIAMSEKMPDFVDEQDFIWYRTIKQMLDSRSLNYEESFKAAQEILQFPIVGFMAKLEGMTDDGE